MLVDHHIGAALKDETESRIDADASEEGVAMGEGEHRRDAAAEIGLERAKLVEVVKRRDRNESRHDLRDQSPVRHRQSRQSAV